MSEIKVNSIKGVGASTAAISIDNSSGTCTANITNNLSNKNLFDNSAMQISQRGDVSGLTASNQVQAVDRMFCRLAGSAGTWTISKSTDAPEGFSNSLKWDCTAANASPHATNDFGYIRQTIEGQNVQHLKKGTANALKTSLSFYVKSNKTGNFAVRLNDQDNSRFIGGTYTINSANTWERKTFTFVGDTSGVLNNDNNGSIQVIWWMVVGSGRTSGSVPTSWTAITQTSEAAGQNVNMADSTSNEFYLTGIQLEVSDHVTDFQHESVGITLAKCQRYYERLEYAGGAMSSGMSGFYNTTTEAFFFYHFRVIKRSAPTLEYSSLSHLDLEPFDDAVSNLSLQLSDTKHIVLESDPVPSETKGFSCYLTIDQANGFIAFNSEF